MKKYAGKIHDMMGGYASTLFIDPDFEYANEEMYDYSYLDYVDDFEDLADQIFYYD